MIISCLLLSSSPNPATTTTLATPRSRDYEYQNDEMATDRWRRCEEPTQYVPHSPPADEALNFLRLFCSLVIFADQLILIVHNAQRGNNLSFRLSHEFRQSLSAFRLCGSHHGTCSTYLPFVFLGCSPATAAVYGVPAGPVTFTCHSCWLRRNRRRGFSLLPSSCRCQRLRWTKRQSCHGLAFPICRNDRSASDTKTTRPEGDNPRATLPERPTRSCFSEPIS